MAERTNPQQKGIRFAVTRTSNASCARLDAVEVAPVMALRVRFAIHRGKKISAVFHAGDERQEIALPDGWEELEPRKILTNERAFDAWIAQDLDARLAGLTPPGFRPKKGIR